MSVASALYSNYKLREGGKVKKLTHDTSRLRRLLHFPQSYLPRNVFPYLPMGYQKRIGMGLRRDRVLNEHSGTYGRVKISENK